MTNNEMRVAIAEACGWVRYQFPDGNIQVRWAKWKRPDKCLMADIPDYPNDLNAMHEPVMSLDARSSQIFEMELESVVQRTCPKGEGRWLKFHMLNATAAQRAEAFLRTLGKWKDA